MFEEPINVTDAAFEKTVLGNTLPVIVDFWAPWCGPCRMVAPTLEKIAKEYAGKLVVAKVNTDENQEWAGKYGVQGIPTMLMLKDGKMSAGEISEHFDMTGATISYHLSQLKKAGLIFESKYKNFIYYEINISVFEEVMLWFTQFGGMKNEN